MKYAVVSKLGSNLTLDEIAACTLAINEGGALEDSQTARRELSHAIAVAILPICSRFEARFQSDAGRNCRVYARHQRGRRARRFPDRQARIVSRDCCSYPSLRREYRWSGGYQAGATRLCQEHCRNE